MKLRCYCCGKAIEGQITLVTYSPDGADRVFVMLPEHVERIDEAATHLLVTPVR